MRKLLACLLFLGGCFANSSRIQHEGPPYIISLGKDIDRIKSTGLTEIGNVITYVPLETSDKSLLGMLNKVIITDSYIAVYSSIAENGILLFDHSGDFIRQISRNGRGPGEYLAMYGVYDYCLSPDGEKIYLLVSGFNCLEYDVEGKYFKTHKIDSFPSRMLPLDDNLFVFYPENTPRQRNGSVEQSLIISDLSNNIQKTYKNYHKRTQFPNVNIGRTPFYSYQGNVRFKEAGADTLFTVTVDELIPYAVLSLGNKELPADIRAPATREAIDAMLAQYSGKFRLQEIVEDADNLYITLSGFLFNIRYGYYNKHSYTIKIIGDEGFQNDIDGGLPFFPKYIYNDSILVDYVNAYDLREHVLSSNAVEMRRLYGQRYDDLVKLANSLDDEDNPILVFVKK